MLHFSLIIALVSDPKVSLEEPSFQVETDSPRSEQVDSDSRVKIKDQTENDSVENLVEPSTLNDDVGSEVD